MLGSTFVLQTQLLFDKVGPQMLPDAGISAQLDLGILPASLLQTDDHISAVQFPATLASYFNAIVPDRAAPHWRSYGQEWGDKMWTQTNPVRAPEAILPPTNQYLPHDQMSPADIPTEQAAIRCGGILGAEGTTHSAPHKSRFDLARCKTRAPTKLPIDLMT